MITFDHEHLIISIEDYPKPGIIFRDITPLLGDAEGFKAAIKHMAEPFRDMGITKVIGTEARGFMFGAPLAVELGAGFVPARKPGKLPREVAKQEYELEYGTNALELHLDAVDENDVVLLADDLIATGGTIIATAKLAQGLGAKVAGMTFFVELKDLPGRAKVEEALPDCKVHSVLKY